MTFRYDPKNFFASIVLIGKFNPPIFSPAWFAKVGIISDQEVEFAQKLFLHSEVAQFSIDRFNLDVKTNRFAISSPQEPFAQILDDVLNLFTNHLPHIPLAMLGINYEVHFNLASYKQRHALGRALAPIGPWGSFGKRLESDKEKTTGGMAVLVMQENPADRQPNQGQRRVQIEPLDALGNTGVRIQVNDHFQLISPKDEDGAAPMIDILRINFDTSIRESKTIVSDLMNYAGNLT